MNTAVNLDKTRHPSPALVRELRRELKRRDSYGEPFDIGMALSMLEKYEGLLQQAYVNELSINPEI